MSQNLQHQTGRWIGRYHLVELLGAGAFGAVYKAETLSVPVAVKLSLDGDNAADESEILLTLQGTQGVPQWLYFGQNQGHWAIAMTLGYKNLEQLRQLNPDSQFTRPTLQKILYQCVTILEAIHSKGVLHRDVKATNIMVSTPEGPNNKVSIVILDFGLAVKYKNEAGRFIDYEEKYEMSPMLHCSPSVQEGWLNCTDDDLIQLTYAAIQLSNDRLAGFMGSDGARLRYKWNLIDDPLRHLPVNLHWLHPFFSCTADHDHDERYNELRRALQESLPESDASGDLHLVLEGGEYKLI